MESQLCSIPKIPFSVLEFTYEAIDEINTNVLSGSLWHGILGKALHQENCKNQGTQCKDCPLLYECAYPYLFRHIAPLDSEIMRGKEVPAPHVFRFNQGEQEPLKQGDIFKIELILIGQANKRAHHLINAMAAAGLEGIGKQRNRARLVQVQQLAPLKKTQLLIDNAIPITPSPIDPLIPEQPNTLSLRFNMPYKPSGKQTNKPLDVGHFVMGVIRRISLLQYFYTDKRLAADFKALKINAESVVICNKQLTWQNTNRYSARHQKNIDTSGWIGYLELDIAQTPKLWPYLWLGQHFGVGKNASMGFGHYTIS